jgi:hypothetical protein
MTSFIIKTNNESFAIDCSIQACQAFREMKENNSKGSYVLLDGDKVLMSYNSNNKSVYSNCNS